jgi:hypothetical protein
MMKKCLFTFHSNKSQQVTSEQSESRTYLQRIRSTKGFPLRRSSIEFSTTSSKQKEKESYKQKILQVNARRKTMNVFSTNDVQKQQTGKLFPRV